MPTTARNFIARMKVRALQRQRDELAETYDAILAEASEQSTGTARVASLTSGLADVELGGEKVHPALPDLRAALRSGLGEAQAATWEARLHREIDHGRARSEAAFVFGRLLEETGAVAKGAAADEALLEGAFRRATTEPAEAASDALRSMLDALFAKDGLLSIAAGSAPRFVDHGAAPPMLQEIAGDPELPATVRAEARTLESDPEAEVALSDGLGLILADIEAWRFSAPVGLRPVTTNHRPRFHPTLDLVTVLVVDMVAAKLGPDLVRLFRTGHVLRRRRYERLLELNGPEIILANERRMLDVPLGALNDARILEAATHSESIVSARDRILFEIGSSYERAAKGYEYGTGQTLLRLLAAELAVRRRVAPEEPVFVLKTDVADCFPSIRHDVVREVLLRAGVPAPLRAFVDTYMAAPLVHAGEVRVARRGLLLGQPLTRLLAGVVLSIAEVELRRTCPELMVLRSVDDFVLLAHSADDLVRGHQALARALGILGLTLNEEKTGAACVGGAAGLPPSLGDLPPSFGLLVVTEAGLTIDEAALRETIDRARTALREEGSLLQAARAFNRDVRSVQDTLLVDLEVAEGHRERTAAALCDRLSEEGGVEGWLRTEIDRRFSPRHHLPEGWLYWPITAGGLGLVDVRLELGARAPSARESPDEPFDERASRAWGSYYAGFLERAKLEEPRVDGAAKALLDDFVSRAGELRGESKTTLAPYWRWVLSTHGADILEAFGTYRFLVKRLVPLELLVRVGSSGPSAGSADDEDGDGDGDGDD